MFYKKEEVDTTLRCSICSGNFQQDSDPRYLPCGESACHKCIQNISNANNEFKCLFCHEEHQPQRTQGFPPNLTATKLIKAKCDLVYRNEDAEKLRLKLHDLRKESEKLRANLENGSDQVQDYCIQLRTQVHLETDILLEQIHQFNENMIAQIDNYEKKCVNTFKRKSANYEKESKQLLAEIERFHGYNSRHLSEFKIDEKKIKDGLALAYEYIEKLKKEDSKLELIKFDGKLMKFTKNEHKLDRSLLGMLSVYRSF
jgi:hypothetical protein